MVHVRSRTNDERTKAHRSFARGALPIVSRISIVLLLPAFHVSAFVLQRPHHVRVKRQFRHPRHILSTGRSSTIDIQCEHSRGLSLFGLTLCAVGGGGGGGLNDPPKSGGRANYGGGGEDDGIDEENKDIISRLKYWIQSDDGREDILTYTISLVFAFVLRTIVVEPRYIPSLSMYPTFKIGDQLAVEKVTKRYRPFLRKQVVVFKPPQNFVDVMDADYGGNTMKSKEALIKRIVGVEGDTVKVRRGKLYVNGEKQDESYTSEDAEYKYGPVMVPEGNVLVLGDNRNHSLDGHIWGFLPKENIIGRAIFVYWPLWRIGSKEMY